MLGGPLGIVEGTVGQAEYLETYVHTQMNKYIKIRVCVSV